MPQQASDAAESLRPSVLSVGTTQMKRWRAPTAQHHITVIELGHNLVRVAQELRERPLDDRHTNIIPELVQKFYRR